MSATCIFCKIAKREIPSHVVHDDADTFAFMDIRPIQPGHVLVIEGPYRPFPRPAGRRPDQGAAGRPAFGPDYPSRAEAAPRRAPGRRLRGAARPSARGADA